MADYIDRGVLIAHLKKDALFDLIERYGITRVIESIPAADVVERKTGKNIAIEYSDCDQFACSQCGIELQDWRRVEYDADNGDVTYHEYRLRFCPNCGAKMIGGDDDGA